MSRSRVVAAFATIILMTLARPSEAQDHRWQLRLSLLKVQPNVNSGEIPGTGTRLAVGGASTPELSLNYRLSPLWALELSGTASKHLLATEGGSASGIDAGSVWLAPVTLNLQAHIYAGPRLDPYVGVGVVMATFHRYTTTPDLDGLGVAELTFENSVRVASQLGVAYRMGQRWQANMDVRYAPITTKVGIPLADGGSLGEVALDINPWLFGAGVGVRF